MVPTLSRSVLSHSKFPRRGCSTTLDDVFEVYRKLQKHPSQNNNNYTKLRTELEAHLERSKLEMSIEDLKMLMYS